MFNSQGKWAKAIHSTSVAVGSEEVSRVTSDDQQLFCSPHRHHNKIDAWGTEIATMRLQLNCALDENTKLQLQEQAMAAKHVNKKGTGPHVPKNRISSHL